MTLKNDNLGLLCGTFLGTIVGSVGTIFVLKKLKKLEYKRDLEAQQKHLNEVYEFYNNKIEELKKLKTGINYAAVEQKNVPEKTPSTTTLTTRIKVTEDGRIDDTILNKSPKTAMQDAQSEDVSDVPDPSDFNIGTGILETDRGWRPKVDYAKISKNKFQNLSKEYEREEIEEPKYPHQITKDSYERAGGYVKEEVMYYEQNGIFATLDDTIVDHLTEEYFGLDNLNLFGTEQASLDGKSDLYEIYLRDEVIHTDYHIIYNGTEDFDHLGDCR